MIQKGKYYIVLGEEHQLYSEVVEIIDISKEGYQYVSLRNHTGTFALSMAPYLLAIEDIGEQCMI